MPAPVFRHSGLGEITPELQRRLSEMSVDRGSISKLDSFTSASRAVLLDIASLQVKGTRTFGAPVVENAAWWVTRHSLQQSTHHAVAALKASWMGSARVVDLCCGLGGDLIALARRGPASGVDINSDVLAFTAANLISAGVKADLHQADVTMDELTRFITDAELIHIDPDRRVDGQRRTAAQALVPNWERVTELLQSCRGGLVKLAPATQIPDDATLAVHRTWIAVSGTVREQSVIAGAALDATWVREHSMKRGDRSAISIRNGIASVFASDADIVLAPNRSDAGVGQWIIDPDVAIRAAGLTETFATATHTRAVGGPSGFLTCDDPAGLGPWPEMAQVARVIDVIGCDDRKLRRWFRAHNGYPDVIKVRDAGIDPAAMCRHMKDCGHSPMGLWIGRQGNRTYAAITQ